MESELTNELPADHPWVEECQIEHPAFVNTDAPTKGELHQDTGAKFSETHREWVQKLYGILTHSSHSTNPLSSV